MASESRTEWNVLHDPWIRVTGKGGQHLVLGPLDVLHRAPQLQAIEADSPMDLFAAHRFLLTLFYWKADSCGGVQSLRQELLAGEVPQEVLEAIASESEKFDLFDSERPFLQDTESKRPLKDSPAYLFTEMASGTNIAHFQHGDDTKSRLCLRCLTLGLVRSIPLSGGGGRGWFASVHGAPPIMALAIGKSVCQTLGLNLVPFPADLPKGRAVWTGPFKPRDTGRKHCDWRQIPYMEALTWNPRSIRLPEPEIGLTCWRCGAQGEDVWSVGQIACTGNSFANKPAGLSKSQRQDFRFIWKDPAIFYPVVEEQTSAKQVWAAHNSGKSMQEKASLQQRDAMGIVSEKATSSAMVVSANPDHHDWLLLLPCTDGKAKTYDVHSLCIPDVTRETLGALVRKKAYLKTEAQGWKLPRHLPSISGAFIRATEAFTNGDWGCIAAAEYREMNQAPEAFDLFSGIYWGLRRRNRRLPRRQTLWLVLKLIAQTPAALRSPSPAGWNPLETLAETASRQIAPKDSRRSALKTYPRQFPRGTELERQLRDILDPHCKRTSPQRIDWVRFCDQLNSLMA